jgi:DNA-binding transcriptional regulator YiaG
MSPKQIRTIRKALGLTQQQLADLIGARPAAHGRTMGTGVHEPQGANLKALKDLADKAKGKIKRKG